MRRLLHIAVLGLAFCSVAAADVAIIAHPTLPINALKVEEVRRLYLKGHVSIETGLIMEVGALPASSQSSQTLYRNVLKMSESRLLTHWSKQIFTGQAKPPQEFDDEQALKQWVANTPNALGYIDIMNVDDQVKVLLTVAQER